MFLLSYTKAMPNQISQTRPVQYLHPKITPRAIQVRSPLVIFIVAILLGWVTGHRAFDNYLLKSNFTRHHLSDLKVLEDLFEVNESDNLVNEEPLRLSHHRVRSQLDSDPTTLSTLHYLSSGESLHLRREWNFTEVNLANSHLFYIRTQFSCSTPRPKLIKVLDYHASASKQYVPRCTVLHRCDDESGCCEDVTHRCEPSKTKLVELYFHVIRSDMRNNITGGSAVGIERLTFLNHTQCECKPINYMPRTLPHASTQSLRAQVAATMQPDEGYHKCRHVIKCPEPFVQRFRGADQRCVCDCLGARHYQRKDIYKYCLEIQNGTAKLDQLWAKCVRSSECAEPVCQFGLEYNQLEARCATQQRRRIRHHRLRHPHHHHRQQTRETVGGQLHPAYD